MKIHILREAGYEEALLGISLSYNQPIQKMSTVALNLAGLDDGHNKFLESIYVWIDITAPRYWWTQFDTYRIAVTKQSESTMHTILKKPLTQDSFESPIPYDILTVLNIYIANKQLNEIKNMLPEGFLQRRIVCTNYKTLRNIIRQRQHHKLKEWNSIFVPEILQQITHPEFLQDVLMS